MGPWTLAGPWPGQLSEFHSALRLAEPATPEDDFVRLASAGEPVRRGAELLGDVPGEVVSLLTTYEAALAAVPALHRDTGAAVTGHVAQLGRARGLPRSDAGGAGGRRDRHRGRARRVPRR